MMRTSIITCADRADIASRALDLMIGQLSQAVVLRGEAHLALTGGSSAAALFGLLRSDERARRVDWPHVHVWQGDERFVPHADTDSNWAAASRDWLDSGDGPAVPLDHRHPIPVDDAIASGHDPEWAAAIYSQELDDRLPRRANAPAFDVVLLGVGGDGHIMSAFPDTSPITETSRPALAVAAPTHIEPHLPRVTLAPFLLAAAGLILVMVPGAAKAEVIAQCVTSTDDPQRWPAQLALRPNAVWLLEPESAAGLR